MCCSVFRTQCQVSGVDLSSSSPVYQDTWTCRHQRMYLKLCSDIEVAHSILPGWKRPRGPAVFDTLAPWSNQLKKDRGKAVLTPCTRVQDRLLWRRDATPYRATRSISSIPERSPKSNSVLQSFQTEKFHFKATESTETVIVKRCRKRCVVHNATLSYSLSAQNAANPFVRWIT